ncbi:MAG: tetratricopeptide repeat protein [Candidatus Ratteibacteria bacterium]
MVDYGAGYFSGLKLGFILIVLGVEFYFFVFEKFIEKDITLPEILIFSILFIFSIVFVVWKLSLISIFIPFFGFIIINLIQQRKEQLITKKSEEKRLNQLEKIISQQPNNINAYVELGDYYFKNEDYSKALEFYRKAYEIKDFPWIKNKIEISEREDKIKKGIIWICKNCGETNTGKDEKCKNCGEEKDILKSVVKDLKETKKYFILLLISPFLVLILLLIIIYMPLYLSIFVFLLLLYFLFRFFLTSE